MASYYVQLPEIRANAMADFSGLRSAIRGLGAQFDDERMRRERQEERTYQRGRNAMVDARYAEERDYRRGRDALADTRYADETVYNRGRLNASDAREAQRFAGQMEDAQTDRDQKKKAAMAGFIRQHIITDQDPASRAAKWQKFLSINPNAASLPQAYHDPMYGPDLVLSEAGITAGQRNDAPTGYRWAADGSSLEPIPGGPASGAKRDLKEYQTKDAMFAERLMRSEAAIEGVAGVDEKGNPKPGAYNPANKLNAWWPDDSDWRTLGTANWFNSKEWQQYQQAAREGIAAILRKDTGAAVTETEWKLYFPMMYPQPGDSPEVVAQKKRAREAASQALRGSSGPAFDVMFPEGPAIPGQQPQQATAAPRARNPQTGETVEWNGQQWVPVQ